jgi:hypothetical protein
MVLLGLLSWWYTTGWKQQALSLREKLASTVDFYSIDLLLRTLFSPFRQISAGRVDGPLNVQMRAFFDRLVSRLIGGMVRLFMIIFGSIAIALHATAGVALLLAWVFVPLLPLLGAVLMITGWIPWTL